MTPMILTIVVASALLVLGPSTLGNAQAQMYNNDNQYGYDNNYKNDYYTEPKSPHTDIQKINCGNSNININGIDINQISKRPNDLATTSSGTAANQQQDGTNGNGLSDSLNVERNLVNVCANVNANEQIKVEPEDPATLTVNKEIFGCTTGSARTMDCSQLQDGSASWLPCIGTTISSNIFCQGLPANIFDIHVLDDQNTQIQQFEGSTAGSIIQNLQPGTYTVNEIKSTQSNENQLGVNEASQEACIIAGFDDGGNLVTIPEELQYNVICFEYEDEQGNDCSTVTLAAGEDKTCTVKNYIRFAFTDVS